MQKTYHQLDLTYHMDFYVLLQLATEMHWKCWGNFGYSFVFFNEEAAEEDAPPATAAVGDIRDLFFTRAVTSLPPPSHCLTRRGIQGRSFLFTPRGTL